MSQPDQDSIAVPNDSAGSSQQWDAIWKRYAADDPSMRKLFTRENPSTIFQFWQQCYFEDLLQIVQPKPDWRFLELASGRGTTSMYLASQGMTDITLVDLSATALQQAELNFAAEKLPLPKTKVADAQDTGLAANRFDCVYNIGVLEHFTDPAIILAESYRLLKPGGQIFMPIVPAMPFSRSLVCRIFLNPISIAKRVVKIALGKNSKNAGGMVRTETGRREYRRVAEQVGFLGAQCIPYNAYWKVNRDGGFVERYLAIPAYKLHHAIKQFLNFRPSLKTLDATASCLLLTGSKPATIEPHH